MGIITENLTFDLIAIAVSVVVGFIAAFKWYLSYWDRLGVPTLKPKLFFGDVKELMLGRLTVGEAFRELYKTFKAKRLKGGGIYFGPKPMYLAVDPQIVKRIMQTDFQHFMNRGSYYNEKDDPLSGHLFHLEDAKWRNMRVKLTPTFTSGKMKMMFQTLNDCAVDLNDIMKDAAENHVPIEVKDILARFTTDIIGSCAFGIQCNSLKDPNAEFRKYGRRNFDIELMDRLKVICTLALPHSILRLVKLKRTKNDVEAFFMKAIRETVNYREKNNIYRKDFMHLLLQVKNRGAVTDDEQVVDKNEKVKTPALTLNELSAQAFVFFLAGFETSSTTMTFALFELACNPEIQEKLRDEIKNVLEKHNGQLNYDAIMEMEYMEKVIEETLRKYPPVALLTRKCNKEIVIPETGTKIEKGISVAIPVLALHTDPEYYPNPEKFDPERFSEDNKKLRPNFTWLPFGEGPRICIGLRFGMMQSKVGLTTLLRNYKIKLNSKTMFPMKLDPTAFVTSALGSVWLHVETLV